MLVDPPDREFALEADEISNDVPATLHDLHVKTLRIQLEIGPLESQLTLESGVCVREGLGWHRDLSYWNVLIPKYRHIVMPRRAQGAKCACLHDVESLLPGTRCDGDFLDPPSLVLAGVSPQDGCHFRDRLERNDLTDITCISPQHSRILALIGA